MSEDGNSLYITDESWVVTKIDMLDLSVKWSTDLHGSYGFY